MQDIHDPEFVRAVFDRCSSHYRIWSALSSFGFVWIWRRQCVAALARTQVQAPIAVDLMAGTGEIWPHLLKARPEIASIVAIDISAEMHKRAVERLHKVRSHRIEHIEADFFRNEIPDAMADLAVCTFGVKTLNHPQQAAFARELTRILKPGGVFSLIEASDPKGWWLRPLYRFYMDRCLPLIERTVLRGAQDFSMIGPYTRSFGDCSHLAGRLREEGLEIHFRRHFFGCATSVAGRKPG